MSTYFKLFINLYFSWFFISRLKKGLFNAQNYSISGAISALTALLQIKKSLQDASPLSKLIFVLFFGKFNVVVNILNVIIIFKSIKHLVE